MNKSLFGPVVIGALILIAFVGMRTFKTVPPGHVAVAALFGKVQKDAFKEGLHFPVNPLYAWYLFDARQKTHKEEAGVPSQDQLQTSIEVSVQFRIIASEAPRILTETGSAESAIMVHLVPKIRSLMREQGKTIKRAEDFFLEKTQENLQRGLHEGLRDYLQPKGINVDAVLIRDIQLPPFITKAIESKKEREQAVEKQRAELERYRTEQQQKIAMAEAEKIAAESEAAQRRVLADAQAYEIEQIKKAIADNPAYLQLKALESLQAIAKDPAAKMYFINSDSPNPVPLMHIGESLK